MNDRRHGMAPTRSIHRFNRAIKDITQWVLKTFTVIFGRSLVAYI
jgi:hypothetical protein